MSFPTAAPERSAPPTGARLVHALERALDHPFGVAANPLRQLGAIGFLLFWIVVATGTYVYAFYDTSADGAWASLVALERDQPWAGGLMRSVHRYASDALMLVVALHVVREWLLGRFKAFRWFTWVSGVPLLWLLTASGIIGFWLAWDRVGAWVALATLEWAAALPGLGDALVRNAVVADSVSDRLFSLLIFLHIGVSLLVLLGMWIHVQRLAAPVTRPRRAAGAALLAALVALAVVLPAPLAEPADVGRLSGAMPVDWFFLAVLPAGAAMPGATWLAVAAVTLLLLALPWLPPAPRAPAAVVDPANCNGCGRCFADCPYGAVVMTTRSDGRAHHALALVDPDLCASCGICAGACPSATPFRSVASLVSGIDVPQRPVQALREELAAALAGAGAGGGRDAATSAARTVVFACRCAADARPMRDAATAVIELECAGQLPPAFVDYALRHGAQAVVVAACADGDCEYRAGATWARDRLLGAREPHLRDGVDRRRLALVRAGPGEEAGLASAVTRLRASLHETDGADPTGSGATPTSEHHG